MRCSFDIPVIKNIGHYTPNNLSDGFVIAATGVDIYEYLNSDEISKEQKNFFRSKFEKLTDEEIQNSNSLLQILRVKK